MAQNMGPHCDCTPPHPRCKHRSVHYTITFGPIAVLLYLFFIKVYTLHGRYSSHLMMHDSKDLPRWHRPVHMDLIPHLIPRNKPVIRSFLQLSLCKLQAVLFSINPQLQKEYQWQLSSSPASWPSST